jgi:hypothetical protein
MNCLPAKPMDQKKRIRQRHLMRLLYRHYDGVQEQVISAYADAERQGRVRRKRNLNHLSPEDYARILWKDGLRWGWIRKKISPQLEYEQLPILQLSAHQGIESTTNFIQAKGGIEDCLKQLEKNGAPVRRGRPSAFSQAIATVDRSEAPRALQSSDLLQDYVLIVGIRGEDGTLQLLHEPVTDDGLVRKAVAALASKGTRPGGSR